MFVGGQSILQDAMPFYGLNPGNYEHTLEIYRGPRQYVYNAITIGFESVCDLQIMTSVYFTVSWARVCAVAEFYEREFKTFLIDSKTYVSFFLDLICTTHFCLNSG